MKDGKATTCNLASLSLQHTKIHDNVRSSKTCSRYGYVNLRETVNKPYLFMDDATSHHIQAKKIQTRVDLDQNLAFTK